MSAAALHSERIDLTSDAEAVGPVQARLMTLGQAAGLDDAAVFQWTCAIVEALNNCIEHAYEEAPGRPISVRWAEYADRLEVEIRDQGRPMPPDLPEHGALAAVDALSGRGWHIIREWTDGIVYRTEPAGNLLVLTRNR